MGKTMKDGVTVIVLAGGASKRFGSDKMVASFRGSTLLGHLVDDLPKEWRVVVVGPRREMPRPVTWAREDPPGGGPLAGIAAGLRHVTTDYVAVCAGDVPHGAGAVDPLLLKLLAIGSKVDAVFATDTERSNPLIAAYRTAALREALPADPANQPAKVLLEMPHETLLFEGLAIVDVDTVQDLSFVESESDKGAP